MKISFDPKTDIMRIKFQDGEYEISKELDEDITVDLTKNNKIMAIEISNISERIPKRNLKEITVGISS